MLDSLLPYFVSIIISIPLALLVLATWRAHQSGGKLKAAILGMTAVHEFFLIAFPCWYSAFHDFKFETEILASPWGLLRIAFLETFFVIMFTSVFFMEGGKNGAPDSKEKASSRDVAFLFLLIVGAVIFYVLTLNSKAYSIQDITASPDKEIKTSFAEMVADWFDAFIGWPGRIAASIALVSPRFPMWLRGAGGLTVLMGIAVPLVNGARGGILLGIELVVACAFVYGSRRVLLTGLVCALLVLPVMPFVNTIMRYESAAAAVLGKTRLEMVSMALPMIKEYLLNPAAFATSDQSPFLDNWVSRAQGPRNCIGLLNLADENGHAGVRPILGGVVMPVPRLFWPDKPVVGSDNSSNLGSSIYRVQQLKPNTFIYEMGPIVAAGHAYWEGGVLWVVIAGLLTGVFWKRLLNWADENSNTFRQVVAMTFLSALPIDGFFTVLNPLCFFIPVAYRLIPVIALMAFLKSRAGERIFNRIFSRPVVE